MLDKDVLGAALNTAANSYNDVPVDVTDPVAIADYRLNFWKGIAQAIIDHIKANALLQVPGAGLVAPGGGGPVTGTSITGSIQ
jgi:hypothetical protein